MKQPWWKTLLIAGLALTCGTAGRALENWPQFRGPEGQGHADEANLPVTWSAQHNVTWRTELPGFGWSSPVIWGEQIWMTTATEAGHSLRALCVDKKSGKLLRDMEVFHRAIPVKINSKNSHASPTPVIEAGRVYVNFGAAGTACLATDTGRILWRSEELQTDHKEGPGSSPMLYQNLLMQAYDGTNTQFVAALDKQTGRVVWQTSRSGAKRANTDYNKAYSTPLPVVVQGVEQLVVPGADWVYGYAPLTGRELWRVGYHAFSTTPRPVTGHGLVYICTGFGTSELLAIRPDGQGDVTATHIAWRYAKKDAPKKPSLLLAGDELYLISDSGAVVCLDAKTGTEIWRQRLGGNFSASPIIANGRIYFCSEEGKTSVLAAGREFRLLATNELGERIMASPAVSGAALFLRTDQALYRIENIP
ncbi:MAG: hypothetical protein EPN23_06590 [Verrucomicrobia bacterium]|nr:MAG: hypothetical protein EPN23_06590 [Verrucomicrobiota bacterium]